MAAKGKAPQVNPPRTIVQLEAELKKRTAERDEAVAREVAVAAERDEVLAQQSATAEVLGVINSSPGDLAPVFDAMLEKAIRLCGAVFGELHTYDGVSFKTSAGRGHSAAFAEARAKNPPAARPGTASARILETKRPVHKRPSGRSSSSARGWLGRTPKVRCAPSSRRRKCRSCARRWVRV